MSPRDRIAEALSLDLLDALEALVDERVTAALAATTSNGNRDDPEWMTLKQAGEQLGGLTPDAVRMLANRGRLKDKHVGRRRYVSRASVQQAGGVG